MHATLLRQTPLDRTARVASWSAQLVAAAILASTLPFKFSGASESVALFTRLGVEPYGRLGLATFELIAVVLLLVPRTAVFGGLLTLGLLSGAVVAHLTVLGIVFQGDASLFVMAVAGLLAGAAVTWLRRRDIPLVGGWFCACEPGSQTLSR